MVSILPALRQVREDLAGLLERKEVERICRELEHTWRERQLDPWTTLHLFILQVVNKNTAMTHLPHLSGERFTASGYCQARQRLPLELIRRVVDSFSRGLEASEPASLWDIASPSSTARAFPCPTHRNCRRTSASPVSKRKAAVSRLRTCWP
jgi:hypothetical protein